MICIKLDELLFCLFILECPVDITAHFCYPFNEKHLSQEYDSCCPFV